MLKFTYLAQLGLAGTVLVPAVVLEQDPAGGLTDALANTTATIQSLERLHSSLIKGDHSQVAATIKATEAPTGDAQLRDERLSYLRDEVSRLRMRWESLEEAMSAHSSKQATPVAPQLDSVPTLPINAAPFSAPLAQASPSQLVTIEPHDLITTGLSEATRANIIQRLSTKEVGPQSSGQAQRTAFEPSGFSANAVRHGRALYKAGRYLDAIALLTASGDQDGAHFWLACSLEKLGRFDDAITAYDVVIETVTDTKDAQHAKRNRDFLIWKRDFDARISVTTAGAITGEGL
jgi:tetratricopeptide (TPR) repeat protein